jgi:hypothetical protein
VTTRCLLTGYAIGIAAWVFVPLLFEYVLLGRLAFAGRYQPLGSTEPNPGVGRF